MNNRQPINGSETIRLQAINSLRYSPTYNENYEINGERDAVIAHGMSLFLKEKLMDTSDAYSTFVCDKCGLFAQRLYRKGNQSHSTSKDVYFCPSCKNYTEISKIMIPYAFKLLVQEMMSMDIAARIRTTKDAFGN